MFQCKNRAALLAVLALLLSAALPSVSWAQNQPAGAPPADEPWTIERLQKLRERSAAEREASAKMLERLREQLAAPVTPRVQAPAETSVPDATGAPPVASSAPVLIVPSQARTSNWFDRPWGPRFRVGGASTFTERSDVRRVGDQKLALHAREGTVGNWELALPATWGSARHYLYLSGESRRESVEPDVTASPGASRYEQGLLLSGLGWEAGAGRWGSFYAASRAIYVDGKAGRPDDRSAEFNGEWRYGLAFWSNHLTVETRPGYHYSTEDWRGPLGTVIVGLHGQRLDLEAQASWSRLETEPIPGKTAIRTSQEARLTLRYHLGHHWDLGLHGGITVVDWDDDRDSTFTQRETGDGPGGLSSYGITLGYRF